MESFGNAASLLWKYSGLNYAKSMVFGGAPYNTLSTQSRHQTPAFGLWTTSSGRSVAVFLKIAGVSGAVAVGLGAYYAHVFSNKEAPQELKKAYETANFYHFIHTIALFGSLLTKRPILSGSLICMGMFIFCGSCYYHALTGSKDIRMVTPVGGVLLMVGWLSMIF